MHKHIKKTSQMGPFPKEVSVASLIAFAVCSAWLNLEAMENVQRTYINEIISVIIKQYITDYFIFTFLYSNIL